jgi:hypothetical protein
LAALDTSVIQVLVPSETGPGVIIKCLALLTLASLLSGAALRFLSDSFWRHWTEAGGGLELELEGFGITRVIAYMVVKPFIWLVSTFPYSYTREGGHRAARSEDLVMAKEHDFDVCRNLSGKPTRRRPISHALSLKPGDIYTGDTFRIDSRPSCSGSVIGFGIKAHFSIDPNSWHQPDRNSTRFEPHSAEW